MGVEVPSNPINRKEQYLAKIAGQAVEIPAEPLTREEAYLDEIAKNGSGGGGGTTNYNALSNKPQIAGTELQGNKSLADLGIASVQSVENITNGESINNFAGVESALSAKQNALTAGTYIQMDNGVISVKRDITQTAQTLYYHITIKSNDNYINVEKTQNGVKVSDTEYNWNVVTSNPANVDDCFTISTSGTNWVFTNLIASTTQPAGYAKTLYKSDPRYDYSTTYVTTVDADKKLIIQAELDDAMATKQDTLTFDDTPTQNSTNPVKSGGVYSALAGKQNALTAGDYIAISNGEISVNPVVPNENVTYEFKTKDASGGDATVTLIKKSGDTVISSTDYRYNSVMGNKYITVDNLFYFGYSTTFTSGSEWGYKLLAASADHAVDYTRTWGYDATVDYTENFTSIDHSGENLVLKAQMDTALATKADTDMVAADFSAATSYTAGNYCVQDGKLYKFKANHSGAWSATDVDEVKITGELSALKSGLTNVSGKVPVRGGFNIHCVQGINVFERNTLTLVSGELPASSFKVCLMSITNHGSDSRTVNSVETDGTDTIIINAQSEQNIYVTWLDITNIPLQQ